MRAAMLAIIVGVALWLLAGWSHRLARAGRERGVGAD
jgi:hypothetical protein